MPFDIPRSASFLAASLFILTFHAESNGQAVTYTSGLAAPVGITGDANGKIWVASQGTGSDDSAIYVITTDGSAHTFMDGLPSGTNSTGEITGTNHVYFDADNNLVIVQGEGTNTLSASIHKVDTTGFVPGATPLDPTAIHTSYDIGSYVSGQGFAESNPYKVATDASSDYYIVDAAANSIIERSTAGGDLEVFATFADVANSTGIGPPFVNAVPTGIVFDGTNFLVGSLTGFPFGDSAATVYSVDLSGNISNFRTGLTTIVDATLDPRDSELVVLQHAAFRAPPPFVPNSGEVLKLRGDGSTESLVTGLNRPAGFWFAPNGDLFITSVADGTVEKADASSTNVDEVEIPSTVFAANTYPNPFQSTTTVQYELSRPTNTRVTIYDVTGRLVTMLEETFREAGTHSVEWDGRQESGLPAPSGIYFYRIETDTESFSAMLIRIR